MTDTERQQYKPSYFYEGLLHAMHKATNGAYNEGIDLKEMLDPVCEYYGITIEQFGIQPSSKQPWVKRWLLGAYKGLCKDGLMTSGGKKGMWALTREGVAHVEGQDPPQDTDVVEPETTDEPETKETTENKPETTVEEDKNDTTTEPSLPLEATELAESVEVTETPVETETEVEVETEVVENDCDACGKDRGPKLLTHTEKGVTSKLCLDCFKGKAAPEHPVTTLNAAQKETLLEQLDTAGPLATVSTQAVDTVVHVAIEKDATTPEQKLKRLSRKAQPNGNGNGNGIPKQVETLTQEPDVKSDTIEGTLMGVYIKGDSFTITWKTQ